MTVSDVLLYCREFVHLVGGETRPGRSSVVSFEKAKSRWRDNSHRTVARRSFASVITGIPSERNCQ